MIAPSIRIKLRVKVLLLTFRISIDDYASGVGGTSEANSLNGTKCVGRVCVEG